MRPVRPSAGIKVWYRAQLDKAIDDMQSSIVYWLKAEWRKHPQLAEDANPAKALVGALKKLTGKWAKEFDWMATKLGERFTQKTLGFADVSLKTALKDLGMTVPMTMTGAMRIGFEAVKAEQVNLIKSIAQQHLTQVESMVMESVQRGRDLGYLSKELQARYGVTKRRAALIARDQNNKATATLTSLRQRHLGITEGIWRHSAAGKTPRPEHVAADGERFSLDKGLYLEGEWVLPGQAINCRCFWTPILPELGEDDAA